MSKNTLKNIRREMIKGRDSMAYVGRATALRLKDGVEVVILCKTDADLQRFADHVADAEPATERKPLDPGRIVNAALVNRNVLSFEDEL